MGKRTRGIAVRITTLGLLAVASVWAADLRAAESLRWQQGSTAPTAATPSQAPTGRLTGEVTDKRGTPLAGTSVAVANEAGKQFGTAVTDANGVFTVDPLPEGEYRLTYNAKGFYKKTEKAKVKAGKTEKVHARLKFIPIQ